MADALIGGFTPVCPDCGQDASWETMPLLADLRIAAPLRCSACGWRGTMPRAVPLVSLSEHTSASGTSEIVTLRHVSQKG
jgi:hypothetical protein